MAYGGYFGGGGASTYDHDRLAASVINGRVSAPLTTADGVEIATRNGEEIAAYFSREAELQEIKAAISAVAAEIFQKMETDREECLLGRYNLAADIIRGTVSAPLTTADGVPIQDRSGNLLFAHRVRGEDRAYADEAIAKAFGELSATVEQYQAQNTAVIQSLVLNIFSGQLPAQLANTVGTGIGTNSGTSIAAVKTL